MTLLHPPLANFWYLLNLVLILPFNFIIYYLLKNRYVYWGVFVVILACYSFGLFDLYFQLPLSAVLSGRLLFRI